MLLSPDLYKEVPKPGSKEYIKNTEISTELVQRRDYLNSKMIPFKKKWANGVMLYNRVSKEALYHRYTAEPDRLGKQTSDGNQSSRTGEDREGKYVCSPLIQQKVDQIKEEYCARTFNCTVKSLAHQEHNYLIQYLEDEVFKSTNFEKAHHSAFEDAIVKGTGFLRTRLYDLKEEQEELVWKTNKKGRKTFTTKKSEISTRKGLEAEYVNIEDVIIDPTANDPQECFICSHLDIFEAKRLFPQLKHLLYDPFSDRLEETEKSFDKKKLEKIRENGYILPEVLPYYKVGEFLVETYKQPDYYENLKEQGTYSASQYTEPNKGIHHGFEEYTENNEWFSGVNNYDSFNGVWGDYYFGSKFNSINSLVYQDKYLLTEYYCWEGQSRYIIMLGGYIIYDGPMIEPFKEMPITPIYFNFKKGNGILGKSLSDKAYDSIIELNETETKYKVAINMSSAIMLGVDESQLEDSEEPIEVKPLTTISFRNNFNAQNPTRPIEQIPIQNPGIQLQGTRLNQLKMEIENLYPDLKNITSQLPKEEIEKIYYSRDLKLNLILKTNANQLSEFAHKVFLNKLKELEYFEDEGKPFVLPPSDSQPRRQRAIFVKQTEKEIEAVFRQVQTIISSQYEEEVMMNAKKLQQDPQTQQEVMAIQQEGKQKLQQAIQIKMKQDGELDPNIVSQLEKGLQQDVLARVESYLMQKAKQMTPMPIDENMYLSYNEILSLKGTADILFQFNKTKQEIQKDMAEFVNFVNSNQLTQVSVNMTDVARQLAVAYDINPAVVTPQGLDPLQTLQSVNTKVNVYYDSAKNPTFFDKFNETYYKISSSTMDDMTSVEKMKTEEIIKRESAKVANEGKSSLLQKSYDQTSQLQMQGLEGNPNTAPNDGNTPQEPQGGESNPT